MEVYFSLTQRPKQILQGGWWFSWGAQTPSILGLPLPVGHHDHLCLIVQLGKSIGGRTAASLGLGAPHFLHIPLAGPLFCGHTHLQGQLGNVVWLSASGTGGYGLCCAFLNQCLITLSSLHVLQLCCSTLSLKAPSLFFPRAFAWTSCRHREQSILLI